MPTILTVSQLADSITGRAPPLDADAALWAYNATDCCVTLAVHEQLATALAARPEAAASYRFVKAMQGPALDMMARGIAIQPQVRAAMVAELEALRASKQALLDRLADAVWGPGQEEHVTYTTESWVPLGKKGQPLKPRTRRVRHVEVRSVPRGLNPGSPAQMLAFFNIALGMPPRLEVRKGPAGSTRSPTAGASALKAWAQVRAKGPGVSPRDRTVPWVHLAAPFVQLISSKAAGAEGDAALGIRECTKLISVLRSGIDADGRMRCAYGVAGTETARWSSRQNVWGGGGNLQNVTPRLRRVFCSDDGWYFVNKDLEQAESRVVAALAWAATGEDAYWRACEGGDLHTIVARMTWPELGWGGDPAGWRAIADLPYPDFPRFSYREVAKRLGHGSNYRGSAGGIAAATGVPAGIVQAFQDRYFAAFPELTQWHQWTIHHLQRDGYLDTPWGRRRHFFGRSDEDKTIREAIAHVPQSTIGELLNEGMRRAWRASLRGAADWNGPRSGPLPIQLLLQNHDAFAFQVPQAEDLGAVLAAVEALMDVPVPIRRQEADGSVVERRLNVPSDAAWGWNWGYCGPSNPDGLAKWKGKVDRRRVQGARPSAAEWWS